MARAKKYDAETRAVPVGLQTAQIKAVGSLDSDDDKNFEKRLKIADRALAEKKIDSKQL
jgi:fructose 1,6-bisphosphatase